MLILQTKGCVKKPHLLYFLDNFLSYRHFLMKFHGNIDLYIPEKHVKFQFNYSNHNGVMYNGVLGLQC